MTSSKIINGWTVAALLLVVAIIAGSVVIGLKCRGNAIEIVLAPDRQVTGTIYVGDAVNNPGYYPVFVGDTLDDIIAAAGGLKAGATTFDVDIIISAGTKDTTQKININRAELWLLEALPNVGETKAQAIIDYRQQHGFFRDISELMNVPGFGEFLFSQVNDLITVND